MRFNTLSKALLVAAQPLMDCGNMTEFRQRLQWLSEGMLANHLRSQGQEPSAKEKEDCTRYIEHVKREKLHQNLGKESHWLYRLGDGNEGCFPRFTISLGEYDDPYMALAVLVENRYTWGKKVRKHVRKEIQVDGEVEHGLHAVVLEGPNGEQAFGAAWIAAELQPLSDKDFEYYSDRNGHYRTLREAVGNPAWLHYMREKASSAIAAARLGAAAEAVK